MADEKQPASDRRNFIGRGNDPFTCVVCGLEVLPLVQGSFRNHCPRCLWSLHVDIVPGDRAATCGGRMEPIAIRGSSASGWDIVHRCEQCGTVQPNRAALDDPRQPDSWEMLQELAGMPDEG